MSMNFTSFFAKSMRCQRLFRLSNLSLCESEYYWQCIHAFPRFKSHVCANSRNQIINETDEKIFHTAKESDQFGTLRKPLEKDFNVKNNSPLNSKIQSKKRVIKFKKPQNVECDTFGNLSENEPFWHSDFNEEPKKDNDLSDDSVIVKTFGKKYRCPDEYLLEMKRLVKEKKIKDALDLFVVMRKQFVAPNKPHFTYMIGACGRIGYTEMAFKLFRQMTDRAFRPSPATLTGLFNSCAESPFPEYGLKKAHHLKEKIQAKNWPLTQITYHAMIKAFGKCGDLMTAFKIVDEMTKADIKINAETYNFLLMSCISNKEAGFTYAVEVWRKMKAKKCVPNIFTFNLFLRAARDCNVGPEEISCLLLQHWSSYSKRPYGFITKEELLKELKEPILELKSKTDSIDSEPIECKQNKCNNFDDKEEKKNKYFANEEKISQELQNTANKSIHLQNFDLPATSLISARPINGQEILEIVDIKTPSDRLSLIGGVKGFLQNMQENSVKPDIKTFALLLECLADNIEAEENLLSVIDSYAVRPTISFFNILIKRRNVRKETESARNVLFLLNKYELTPDIMTFGSLALGCRTFHQACTFFDEMKKFGTTPNIEIAGSLVRHASLILDFPYMKYMLTLMEKENIRPDARLLTSVEKALSDARKNIILMEQGKKFNKFYEKKNIRADFKEFCKFYEEWLKRRKFGPEEHPWLQYKTEIIDRVKEENFVLSNNS